jgi:hypothetical protein
MSTPSRSNIRHFWLRDKKNRRVAVVATEVFSVSDPATIAYSVATHNPIDKFNPKIALNVVEGRLQVSTNYVNKNLGSVKAQILKHLAIDMMFVDPGNDNSPVAPKYPERTRRAARLWLKTHPQPVEKE